MKGNNLKTMVVVVLALMLGGVFAACESPTAVEDAEEAAVLDAAALADEVADELSLSSEQREGVQDAVRRDERRTREPGYLWLLAAELQQTLTDEQIAELLSRTNDRDMEGPGGIPGPGGFDGHRGPDGPGGGGQGLGRWLDELLTDEQQAAVEEIRSRYEEQFEALKEAHRDGTLDDEAFREQMQALHDAMYAEIDALLTDEQRAEIEARQAEREAEREAREAEREAERAARLAEEQAVIQEVLGLTDSELATLAALWEEQHAQRDALIEQFRNEAITQEELEAALSLLKASTDAELQALLDETQYEIVQIHHALAVRSERRGGGSRRGGPEGGPGRGGPGTGG